MGERTAASTVELTRENFEETVAGDGMVLVDFWASWCGPCRMFAPVYERAAQRNPGIVFGKVDTEAQPELAGAFGISSIPTLMIVRDGIVVYAQPGALPEAALDELIGKARALDMDAVRRESPGTAQERRRVSMPAMDRAAWDERYTAASSVWGEGANVFVAEALAGRRPGRALDVACGEGRNALWLAERGWAVTGVDFSRVALAKARAQAERRRLKAEWVEADVTAYESEPESFDAVVLAYLHLPSDLLNMVLSRAARAVAPGGVLVVVGHDATNPAQGVGGPQDPALLYTAAHLAEAVAPLRIERAERVQREVAGAQRPALDALLIAART